MTRIIGARVALLVSAILAAPVAAQTALYAGAIAYDAGPTGESLAIADLDGVGRPDMAVANSAAGTVSILLADALGGFEAPVPYPAGETPTWVATGDVDEDGKVDLVVANQGAGGVSVLLALGGGAFAAPKSFDAGNAPRCVALGLFNADTHLDMAVANAASQDVTVLYGHGDGSFVKGPTLPVGSSPWCVIGADVNGDTRPDLAVVHKIGGTLSILLGLGSGAFAPAVSYPAPFGATFLAAGDLEGDGDLDLGVSYNGGAAWLPGLGAGTFGASISLDVVGSGHGIVLADFGGDGLLDMAALSRKADKESIATVRLGQGGGVLGQATVYPMGSDPFALATADLTGDGLLDLAVTDAGSNDNALAFVLAGTGGGLFSLGAGYDLGGAASDVEIADFTADGHFDVVASCYGILDAITVYAGLPGGTLVHPTVFGAGPDPHALAVGDLDGDGQPDIVVTNNSEDTLTALVASAPGQFQPFVSSPAGTNPQQLELGDLDGDGLLDAIITHFAQGEVSVLQGQGDGTFGSPSPYTLGGFGPEFDVADIDGDGHLDVAVALGFGVPVGVLYGQAGGALAPKVDVTGEINASGVLAADVDEDDLLDLVIANWYLDPFISILPGTGGGAFSAAEDHDAGPYATRMVVGDITGDGWPDIALASYSSTINVLPSTGSGNFGEAQVFAGGHESVDLALGDLSGDGRLDAVVGLFDLAPDNLVVLLHQAPEPAPWVGLDHGLLGAAGVPSLFGTGTLEAGSSGALTLQSAKPLTAGVLFVSFASTPMPFKGGGLATIPVALIFGVATDAHGELELPWIWPAGVPAGTELFFQTALVDDVAPQGAALSNALKAITP